MALITRLARLFQADLHAVLDKIEEPAVLLKQSIREMEESVAADERQIRQYEYERKQLSHKLDQFEQSQTDLEEKCAICFKSGNDGLARALIKRKLETQQAKRLLTEKIAALKEKTDRLSARLSEHRAQLTEMRQKADLVLEENRAQPDGWNFPPTSVRDEDVEVAFLHEKQKWSES